MGGKRSPSLATTLIRAARAGAALRVTLPDGTIIETLTGTETPLPIATLPQNEWDVVLPDGHARN